VKGWQQALIGFSVSVVSLILFALLVYFQCPKGETLVCTKGDCRVEIAYITMDEMTFPVEKEVCQRRECHCEKVKK
jgi:hypothetical protein